MVRSSKAQKDASSSNEENSAPNTDPLVASLEDLAAKDDGLLPKMAVFDLDYTLWPLWVDTHVDTPLKRKGEAINKVVDRYGQSLSFFPHVPSILFFCKRHSIAVAAASRTSAPTAARQALNGLYLIDDSPSGSNKSSQPRKAWTLFDFTEIYPGSKITHFKKLQADSGIEYEDMIFFDDEHRNSEVGNKLGVHFVEVGHQGLDLGTWTRGIAEWRARQSARKGDGKDADIASKV
ncbi:unnamed protein product [Sympodiomycopsis kandeliae]